MRVAVLNGPNDLTVQDRPEPRPGAGQVKVRGHSVRLCGSDTHYYDHGRIGHFVVKEPSFSDTKPPASWSR